MPHCSRSKEALIPRFALLVSLAFGVSIGCSAHRGTGHQPNRSSTYAGPNGHKMVLIPASEFVMGSPPSEAGRSQVETAHRVRIPRAYALATTEVTNEQFAHFLSAVPDYAARWKRATTARFGDPQDTAPSAAAMTIASAEMNRAAGRCIASSVRQPCRPGSPS